MSARHDAIVLGSSIDGLAAACTLAAGGRSVQDVDGCETPGADAGRIEFHPGFTAPGLFLDTAHARRSLLADLNLESHGLSWRKEEPALHVPTEQSTLALHADPARMVAALRDDHPRDAEAYAAWSTLLGRYAPILVGLVDDAPPDPTDPSPGELFQLGMRALSVRRLGEKDMHELVRVAPLPAADWMDENFETEALKTGLVAPALFGTVLGPRAAGTAALMLLRHATRTTGPEGGPAALVDALVKALGASGGTLRLGAPPRSIELDDEGTVAALVLETGERLETELVLSAHDPKRTFMELLPPPALSTNLETMARNWRTRGSHAVLLLALSEAPGFERAISAGSLVELEQASDHLKYGRLGEPLWVQVDVPSVSDPSLAPAGGAVSCLVAHGVPHTLVEGWDGASADRLEASMLAALERVAPGLGERIVGKELLTPDLLESRFGLPGAHPFGGELALDQLWLQRPALALSRYATPIPGLYLGGAANHPGGPFLGGAGVLAARRALG